MDLLTIGSFARASRLSPKALRLYDQLGLLRPAYVDPVSGYRFYDPGQLEHARLVAWLRRLGMPLARIRVVCELPASEAASEISTYWSGVESATAARRDLAGFLIDYLSGKDAAMLDAHKTLGIRYAVRSDIGLHRELNEDSAYAGARLLAVADGLGGHAGGEVASAAAIDALKPLDAELPAGELLNALEHAVHQANESLQHIVETDPSLQGLGTTLTAMLWSGSQLALVHIGDSRAYLLRDGELFQITHDHTLVQTLVDEGRLTPAEAASHPQRSLLLRAIDGKQSQPDLKLHDAIAGDRYLLCSDGLHDVVSPEQLREVLGTVAEPEDVVRQLIDLAIEGGGPDNITGVVADVVEL
jgi:PPM family protein phosphatase